MLAAFLATPGTLISRSSRFLRRPPFPTFSERFPYLNPGDHRWHGTDAKWSDVLRHHPGPRDLHGCRTAPEAVDVNSWEIIMSDQRIYAWGRWIRASVAHRYLGVDRNWFARNVRPYVPVLRLSTQARAYRKTDLDARAKQIEQELLMPLSESASIDPLNSSREDIRGNGRPIVQKGGKPTWVEPERVGSPLTKTATGSSRRKSSDAPSSEGSGQSPSKRQNESLPEKSSAFDSPARRDRVLRLLSEKLRSAT